jgi:hypothetical protein
MSGRFDRDFGNWLPDDPVDPEDLSPEERLERFPDYYAECADCAEVFDRDEELSICDDGKLRCAGCADLAVKVS